MKSILWKVLFFVGLASLAYFFLDRPLAEGIKHLSKEWRPLFKLGTVLIFPPLHLALWVGAFLLMRLKKHPLCLPLFEIATVQCIGVAVVRLSKVLIGRARPDLFLKKGIYGFYGLEWNHHFHSFPSGHTMAAFTLAASLSLILPRYRYLCFGCAALLSLSRPLLLGHFLSDVIGTAVISYLIANLVHQFMKKFTWRPYDTPF